MEKIPRPLGKPFYSKCENIKRSSRLSWRFDKFKNSSIPFVAVLKFLSVTHKSEHYLFGIILFFFTITLQSWGRATILRCSCSCNDHSAPKPKITVSVTLLKRDRNTEHADWKHSINKSWYCSYGKKILWQYHMLMSQSTPWWI